jgi:hypothetical protein
MVFPYLDFLIASRNIRESSETGGGILPIDMRSVVRVSGILCLICLVSSVVLAIKAPDNEGDQEE